VHTKKFHTWLNWFGFVITNLLTSRYAPGIFLFVMKSFWYWDLRCLTFFFFFFFCGARVWIRGLMLARQVCATSWVTPPELSCVGYFQDRVWRNICPGWLRTTSRSHFCLCILCMHRIISNVRKAGGRKEKVLRVKEGRSALHIYMWRWHDETHTTLKRRKEKTITMKSFHINAQ
jgi:hypothetical protein